MSGDGPQDVPKGVVPLSAAIGALRDELTRAWWDGRDLCRPETRSCR